MSKFDGMRPSNFHKVLKTSVSQPFSVRTTKGEIPTIEEVPTIKMCADKRVMLSSGSFFSYRANVNCSGSFGELVYTGMSLTSKAMDEKFPGKVQVCFASQ